MRIPVTRWVAILAAGLVLASMSGPAASLLTDDRVRRAYLG